MAKIIKDFENFSKKQAVANGQTQWEKKYDDGQSAFLCIDNSRITRQKVRDAFSEQEYQNSDERKMEAEMFPCVH
jgi:hypothetical protein